MGLSAPYGLKEGSRVAVDSAPLIYFLEDHRTLAERFVPLFEAEAAGGIEIAVSAIAVAEKKLGGKPADVTAKKTLATAYFKRAFALTEARQYASALGDYRRAMKYDPSNPEAKSWIDKIILIYSGMNKDYPKEGEEPPALPFTKGN